MVTIRGVLFDFGNVIQRVDHQRLLVNLSRLCGMPPGDIHQLVYAGTALSRDYETGLLSSRDFLERVSELCGFRFEEAAFIDAFNDIFSPIETTSQLIRRLKPHYRLGLVSNTNEWHFERTIRTCDVFPLFDAVSLSYVVGVFKPDRRLVEDALAKLGLTAKECVFIDDLPENIQEARLVGVHGIVYTAPEMLLEELQKLGVWV